MSVSVQAKWEGGEPLRHFSVLKAMTAWGDATGPYVRSLLKERTPVVTGRMKESERYARTGYAAGIRLEWWAHTPYAKYVIYGTRPHIIEARAARYLHWYSASGGEHFAKRVKHPGNRPNPFPQEVMDAVKHEVVQDLRNRISDALRRGNV